MECNPAHDQTLMTIETAEQWVERSNHKDLEGLMDLTAPQIEIIGPQGSGLMNNADLGEWLERANLQLATINRYAKDERIVLEQHGTWLHEDGHIKGEAIVFTVFSVKDRKVHSLARYDGKAQAFQVSGLSEEDKVD
ncbi:hypothetical protein [Paenibacillus sp. MDMC362]|uniref:hypothetical protein n=1 Tax=Paenibacillus sp. MDMC362 TaxID=2977365 RepID=UPI000DC42372|nr:hypothetical protein [Paenibacillus sp. MDMC362]RAR44218.1 hypothetical protein DP091_09340 [Paenibacillus sp. MDMC362]